MPMSVKLDLSSRKEHLIKWFLDGRALTPFPGTDLMKAQNELVRDGLVKVQNGKIVSVEAGFEAARQKRAEETLAAIKAEQKKKHDEERATAEAHNRSYSRYEDQILF